MAQKWNLQDIRPAQPRKRRAPTGRPVNMAARPMREEAPAQDDGYEEDVPQVEIVDGRRKKSRTLIWGIVVFVVIVAGGFVASALTGGAELTVYPRNAQPNVNAVFIAAKTPRTNQLTYEVLPLEASGERQVTASGEQPASEQATGEIEIFKTTPGAQRLIKNTRFESPDGLIYKIEESVVVPGAVRAADGTTVPGSIRARVFSDGTGEEFNKPAGTRFTIPGLESDRALFESMYASNLEAFSGGFEGTRFSVDEDELKTATQALQTELRNSLLEQVETAVPAGFTYFPDSVTFTYNTLPPVEYGQDLVTIKEVATLQVPIFKSDDFAAFIADATIPGYEGLDVRIDDTSVFTFSYESATTSSSNLADLPSIAFQLSGKPLIVWAYDVEQLKVDLLGARKTAIPTVLGGYPAIERARAVIRPFWQSTFPRTVDDIEVIEVIE